MNSDARVLVAPGRDEKGGLLAYDPTGKLLHRFPGHSGDIGLVAVSADGSRVASASGPPPAAEIKVWDATSGRVHLALEGGSAGFALNADGSRLAVRTGNELSVWDVASGKKQLTTKPNCADFEAPLAFSPDGKRLAMVCLDQDGFEVEKVVLWDALTGKEEWTLRRPTLPAAWVNSLTFSRDGTRIAAGTGGGREHEVLVWDTTTGEHLLSLKGHRGEVGSVAFSPDGLRLASATGFSQGGGTGEVILWDLAGRRLLTLNGHRGGISQLAFSGDGNRLFAIGFVSGPRPSELVRMWDATPVSAKKGP